MMTIQSVFSDAFLPYGKVLTEYAVDDCVAALQSLPCPDQGVDYHPSEPALEALPLAAQLRDGFYGGMPIQMGLCNGHNGTLNCLEYHRDSEVDIFADEAVLLVAHQWQIRGGPLDTSCVKAFAVPAGHAVELYATTLHYAPCTPQEGQCFRACIVLPRGTNTEAPQAPRTGAEGALLWARNKWLLAHPDSPEAAAGAFVGLTGENLRLW